MRKREVIRRLLAYLRPHRLQLCLCMLCAAAGALFMVLAPYLIGRVTTALFAGVASGAFPWAEIAGLLIALVALYLVSQCFTLLQGRGMARVTARAMAALRSDVDQKMHRLKLSHYDAHAHGDLLSVITNDVDSVNNALSQNLTSAVTQIATAAGVLAMMLAISPALSLIPIATVPLSLLGAAGAMKAGQRHYGRQQELLGQMNGFIEEMYNGQQIVQTFNHQARAKAAFDALNAKLRESARRAEQTSGAVSPLATLASDLGYVLLAALGCLRAIAGRIAVGNVQAMLEYTWRFAEPFSTLAGMSGSFAAAAAAGGRIFELLDAREEVSDPRDAIAPASRNGSVRFRDVSFGYAPGRPLMKRVNLRVSPGQKVAVVGPTGAGKTTLINLLMRFYEVDGGAIEVDGVDVRRMRRAELRARFGMVLQDSWLFEGSIAENIAYARPGMARGEIVAAAKSACAHDFIKTLPGGYDMRLSRGAENISQGERQLITIARAIASDPEILILDEATSNVDAHTEALIQRAMAALMRGRTSFVIAHRLSTIRDADLILYMENGDILEQGAHDALMRQNGRYAALYNSQFG